MKKNTELLTATIAVVGALEDLILDAAEGDSDDDEALPVDPELIDLAYMLGRARQLAERIAQERSVENASM